MTSILVPPQVLWELEKPVVSAWDVEFMVSVERQCIVYVSFKLSGGVSWYVCMPLMGHRQNDETDELYDSVAIDPPLVDSPLHRVELDAGSAQFLFILAKPRGFVLDTRTRVFYKPPGSRYVVASTSDECKVNMIRCGH